MTTLMRITPAIVMPMELLLIVMTSCPVPPVRPLPPRRQAKGNVSLAVLLTTLTNIAGVGTLLGSRVLVLCAVY